MNSMSQPQQIKSQDYIRSMIIIGIFFFIFGFVTWLNSVLIPYLKIACELNNFESYFVAFAFYLSYLVMAIPSAWVLELTGFKKGMSLGLVVMAIGALLFIPAAQERKYWLFLIGLFTQGTGLAILQTASNPYVTILGDIKSAAKRISIMGICNKIAGALAPVIIGAIALKDVDKLVLRLKTLDSTEKAAELNQLAARVIGPYMIIVGVLLLLAIMVFFANLPEVETEEEDVVITTVQTHKTSIFQFPHLLLGVFALFLYVGVEVMAGDTIVSYAASQGVPLSTAKFYASATLIAMIIGYIFGIICIPKYFSQEKCLQLSALLGAILTTGAVMTHGTVSIFFISVLGLANSLMWPAIWPLALSGLGKFTKIGSSFLIMAIAGGALLPLLYGRLADIFNPQQAYWMMVPCYLFILYYAVSGYKAGKSV